MRGKRRKERMILKNATLHIGNGEVFQGDMRIADGKIVEVGKNINGDESRSLNGKHVFPGFIDSGNFLGAQDMAFLQRTITKTRTLSRRISISGILLIQMS